MRIILLGAPGSGKGTQGPILAVYFGATHLSTGELLRHEIAGGTELGQRVRSYVQAGELVPDEIIFELLGGPIAAAAASGGFVLDGFPRSLHQAEEAYTRAELAGVTADAVVNLAVPDDIVRQRLNTRAADGRADDGDPDVIERRLRIYHSETEPLLDFYRHRGLLVTIDATKPPDEVTAAVIAVLEERSPA
ncbi:MAG TPA: adenylate kinase [Acidimicrobiales bacterium]|nr:adenylate kinase [Acidimicrobiales bacterium]